MSALAAYLDLLPRARAKPGASTAAFAGGGDASFAAQLHAMSLGRRAAVFLAVYALGTAIMLASWVCIGNGALSGRLDAGWLAAWALALLTSIPLRAWSQWIERVTALRFGGVLRERLLAGATAMDANAIRRRGAGELMSEVLDADAIDGAGAAAVLQCVLGGVEVLLGSALLLAGTSAWPELAVLGFCLTLFAILFRRNLQQRATLTAQRRRMTGAMVEKMAAHRTRLAQQSPDEWHAKEDRELSLYLATSRQLDRSTALLAGALPRLYVLLALAVLVPAFVAGHATLASLAITLGAVLFVAAALDAACNESPRVAATWLAWRALRSILGAAEAKTAMPDAGAARDATTSSGPAIQAHNLTFTHPGRPVPTIHDCSLNVERGDRILLEGESGGGKSTLAGMLAGMHEPDAGFVLAGGLDRQTRGGQAWRRDVAMAPQYHENHIFAAPLSFNLLLGRHGPHRRATGRRPKSCVSSLGWVHCWNACRPGSISWWEIPAGVCRKASAVACFWPAHYCRVPVR
ncbi:MAG: ABC transporter ATP-binding protein/permease, partial [Pseudomonadota bacterium]